MLKASAQDPHFSQFYMSPLNLNPAMAGAFDGNSLWMSGFAFYILVRTLLAIHPKDSPLAIAIGRDSKGYISLVLYTIAIPLSFVSAMLASLFYVAVAIIWFIPDRRIENTLTK